MRILFHSIYFHPEVGGMESHILHLAEELAERGHEITLVTSRSIEGTKRRERIGKIDVHRVPLPFRSPIGFFLYVLRSVPLFLRLARSCDIIHCHSFASALAGAFARRKRRPLVVTIHTSHFNRLSRKRIFRPFLRAILSRADCLLTASRELAELAGAVIPGREITPMPNAVSIRHFRPPEGWCARDIDRLRLLYSGHLLPVKGVDILVRALPLLDFDWELRIVGDGPFKTELVEMATRLGVIERITFEGMVPHDSMPGQLAKADIILLPSRIEATSIAALEALACGRVVVASNTGGLPEIVRDGWGYLFRREDPEDLARVLNRVFQERDRLHDMGSKGAEFARTEYSTAAQAERIESIYQRLLHERGIEV
jgi:glycosyltransferase involved in cell wall biosynthesis